MKKIYLLLFAFVLTLSVSAQSYTPEEAVKHVGENVKVCGKIFGGRFFETSKDAPTLLNVGAAFPSSPFTIMITKEVRQKMGNAPEIELKEKNVCVTGKVILFKEKPEIIVEESKQLTIEKL